MSDPGVAPARAGLGWIGLAVAGLSLWFWIGYPFANHNESYAWIAQLRSMSLGDALTRHLIGVANLRPLGTAGAWLGFKASGGSIAPIELFNYTVAVLAWAWLACRASERRVFALVALVVGGALFTGYIYLFHLHGIFYSPLLAWIAVLLGWGRSPVSGTKMLLLSIGAALTALFHPFALPLFGAFVAGLWLERRASLVAAVSAIAASAALAAVLLAGGRSVPIGPETWRGLAFSYRMVEIHPAVTLVALVLIAATAWTTRVPRDARILYTAALVGAGIAATGFIGSALPVWVIACFAKLAREKRWSWAALLALAAIFPIAYPTGSPTYTVPVWMIAAATLALGAERWEARLARVPEIAPWAAVVLVLALVWTVHSGTRVPIFSRLAEPLLSESERTRQMESVLRWALASGYRDDHIVLYREARSPNESANAVERVHRPPTQQAHLNRYLAALRPGPASGEGRLLISFGSEAVPDAQLVFRLPGRYAGEARAYRRR